MVQAMMKIHRPVTSRAFSASTEGIKKKLPIIKSEFDTRYIRAFMDNPGSFQLAQSFLMKTILLAAV